MIKIVQKDRTAEQEKNLILSFIHIKNTNKLSIIIILT